MILLTIQLNELPEEPHSWNSLPDGCYVTDTGEMYLLKQPNRVYLGNYNEVLNGTFVGLPVLVEM
jgi:hypothetical protein